MRNWTHCNVCALGVVLLQVRTERPFYGQVPQGHRNVYAPEVVLLQAEVVLLQVGIGWPSQR